MKQVSIRRRLVALLLGSLALVWGAMLVFAYLELRHEVDELADARLRQNAYTLQLLDLRRLSALTRDEAEGGPEAEHDDEHTRYVEFQVWRDDGTLLLKTPGAPETGFIARDGFAKHTGGWRSYAVQQPSHRVQVRVFDTMGSRSHIVDKLAWRMAQSLLLALPVLALLIWIGIGRGLAPLAVVSRAIGMRDAGNLQALDLRRVPAEVQPVVDALNKLLARLSESIDRERSFTADAAHELRTPLAAIKVQAEVALAAENDEHGGEQRRHAIAQVIAGVQRTTRLAQQLLFLARLDHAADSDLQAVDLGGIAADSAARYADEAARRNIELDLDATPDCIVRGDPVALSIMVDNLLDNAVKYGRAGGQVHLQVVREHGRPVLIVQDDGPGVPAQFRARLADRFYRVPGSDAEGSGLGLSIVDRIARRCGAVLGIGEGEGGKGLRVSVRFPE